MNFLHCSLHTDPPLSSVPLHPALPSILLLVSYYWGAPEGAIRSLSHVKGDLLLPLLLVSITLAFTFVSFC